ncbi:MAG: MaoC family dehydratase N-terminal domain-containing protein [Rhodobiaceae bacterium]|nr:MaoC family dehydratase N-terminal domain-containing protein [Rhodobiaceae bacterium]
MAFDPEKLKNWSFPDIRHRYTARDAIIYALGVGLPLTQGDSEDLNFLLEDRLKVVPTFAVTLASPGMWVRTPELGIDWVKLLHAGQAASFETPLPAEAEVIGKARIKSLHDRGPEKGAICVVERRIEDAVSGTLYCTIDQTVIMRGNGGFGGDAPPKDAKPTPPDRAADLVETVNLSPRAALIYRLSGDVNPLHADYEVARKAGFDRPIMHGLGSYGTTGALIVMRFCDGDPARLKDLSLRFSGVIYPGDEIVFSFWKEGSDVLFEAVVGDRKVLDQGKARIG